ncbi:hypothetical protein BA895_21070 [Humibacillus sp. DSM 29435]|nr:hypothetical protein BA895_21070 [Humibacillus sp. DSM 29435]
MVGFVADDGLDLALSQRFARQVVGAEANVATGLARLGRRVGFFGRVGTDALGDSIVRGLQAEGVDVSRVVRDATRRTGVLLRDVWVERPIQVAYYRSDSAGAALGSGDIDGSYVRSARLLHLTGITAILSDSAWECTRAVVEAARESGVAVVFDPNLRRSLCTDEVAIPRLRDLAALCNVVLAGLDEVVALTGERDTEAGARAILASGPALVVVKDGARGSWAFDRDQYWHQPVFPVTATDPVGAGDAFAAGFLHAWLDSPSVPGALTTAAITSALCVATRGDSAGLPFADDVTALEAGETDVRR